MCDKHQPVERLALGSKLCICCVKADLERSQENLAMQRKTSSSLATKLRAAEARCKRMGEALRDVMSMRFGAWSRAEDCARWMDEVKPRALAALTPSEAGKGDGT